MVEDRIEKQGLFVKWLRKNDMYNEFASASLMEIMFQVWVKKQEEIHECMKTNELFAKLNQENNAEIERLKAELSKAIEKMSRFVSELQGRQVKGSIELLDFLDNIIFEYKEFLSKHKESNK